MLGENLMKGSGLIPPAKWFFLVVAGLLLMFAAQPAVAIPQPEATAITLPARPIRSDNNSALSLPATSIAGRSAIAYAPEATPAVMTLTAPAPVPDVTITRDPTGPSSLALLAVGLGLTLWAVRNRRWMR